VTKGDKLVERLLRRPPTAKFTDVRKVLEMYGWTMTRQESSHVTFTKQGEYPITVPLDGRNVKKKYLNDICTRLGLDEEMEAEEHE
jgi:predicted RNA binding protein YcfA (HicA-like mRNA interferase family)